MALFSYLGLRNAAVCTSPVPSINSANWFSNPADRKTNSADRKTNPADRKTNSAD